MSYFIPRLRHLNSKAGDAGKVKWPAKATVIAHLVPAEVFGPSDQHAPRMTLVQGVSGTSVNVIYNANNGRFHVESDVFLPLLEENIISGKFNVSFCGNTLTVTVDIEAQHELDLCLTYVEYLIPSYLSLYIGTYVRADDISVKFEPDIFLNFEIQTMRSPSYLLLNAQKRKKDICTAIEFTEAKSPAINRYAYACLYFQQALRLTSSHEVHIPGGFVSEVMLNLAKCLETLFSDDREKLRAKCTLLGYSSDEIESQIVPIPVIRSHFDVAHPVGPRIAYEHIESIHEYAARSLHNVKNLLVRLAKRLREDPSILDPFPEGRADDRIKLAKRVEEHLKKPPLPVETEVSENP